MHLIRGDVNIAQDISIFPFVKSTTGYFWAKTVSTPRLVGVDESQIFSRGLRSQIFSKGHFQRGNWHFLHCGFFGQPRQTSYSRQSPRKKSIKSYSNSKHQKYYRQNVRTKKKINHLLNTCIFPHSIMFLSCIQNQSIILSKNFFLEKPAGLCLSPQ